jgi:hypothetical protein
MSEYITKLIIKNHKDKGRYWPYNGRYTKIFDLLNKDNLGFTEGYCEHDDSPGMIGGDYHLWIDGDVEYQYRQQIMDRIKDIKFLT